MKDFKILPFERSHNNFQMLYQLQKSLDDHVANFGSVGMLGYYVNLIPEKCDPQFQFLEKDNMVFGYVYTGHQSEVF